MTNSQIQARLQKAYQTHLEEEERFKEHLKQGEKPVITEPELCYLPEFKEGEKYLFLDEREDFQAEQSYLNQKGKCVTALNRISNEHGNFILHKESTLAFFDRYYPLYKELFHQWNYRAFHLFRHLFFYLIDWREFYLMGDKANAATSTFSSYNQDDLLDWLDDHNRLYFCNSVFWQADRFTLIDEENHLYQTKNESFTTFLQGKEITECIEFGELYLKFHKQFN